MTIIFAENFSQDTATSIVQRYNGSAITAGSTNPPNTFPIAATTDRFVAAFPVFEESTNQRLELVLTVGGIDGTPSSQNGVNFFGFNVVATSAGVVTVNAVPASITGAELLQSENWHFIYEVQDLNHTLSWIVDDRVVMNRKTVTPPTWTWGIQPNGAAPYFIPRYVSSIVLAYDTDPSTMLTDLAFVERGWTATTTDWVASDISIVGDTDKTDPLDDSTYIEAIDLPSPGNPVELGVNLETETNVLINKLYLAGTRDYEQQTSLSTSGKDAPVFLQTIPQYIDNVPESFSLNLITGARNGLGFEFLGEVSPITYADLCTAVGFTAGALTAGAAPGVDVFLHVVLDGQEMLIPKVPVRHSVSWDHIYAAGLVYGTNDNGLFPTGTPTNQNKVITIGGQTYLVNLLKGADPELDTYLGANGYDRPDTRRSEFSRIFYPLVTNDPNITSYHGIKVGNYSMEELGTINTWGNGVNSWCQERGNNANTYRLYRGNLGPSYVNASAVSSAANTNYGWRPALRRVG